MATIVDLTQTLTPRAPRSVDHPEVTFPTLRFFSRNGSMTRAIHASLHAGTHVDAPCMYFPERETIDQIPISRLYGPGVVVDVKKEQWGVITADDLAAADVRAGDIVVLYTGWSQYFGRNEETYMLKQPGMDRSAIDWLVAKKVNFVCADLPSAEHIFMRLARWKQIRPDIFGDIEADPERFPPSYGHKTFFVNDILMCDHIGGDVATLAGRRCMIGIMCAKYGGVEAAPARVFAVVD
ncbi:MAG: cyclase family protein [Candidatus Dormibacteraceae bacterium]